jgi:hypothetical protein
MKKLATAVLLFLATTTLAQKSEKIVLFTDHVIPFTYDKKTGDVVGVAQDYVPPNIKGGIIPHKNGFTFSGNDVVYIVSAPTSTSAHSCIFSKLTIRYSSNWNFEGEAYWPLTLTKMERNGNDITLTASKNGMIYALSREGNNVTLRVQKPSQVAAK